MAKTFQIDLSTGQFKLRTIAGRSIYWGGAVNARATNATNPQSEVLVVTNTTGNLNDGIAMDQAHAGSGTPDPVDFGRLLMEIDISGLPTNAVIQTATLRLVGGNHGQAYGPWTQSPHQFAIYRLLRTVDFSAATFQHYASGQAWGTFGLQDSVDYRNVAEATFSVNLIGNPTGEFYNLNVLNLARYFAATDSRKIQAVISRTDTSLRSFRQFTNVGGDSAAEIELAIATSFMPRLTITYVDALSHHPANEDGTIDTSIQVDTTTGGIHLFEPIRVGTFGGAVKFFVKNNLASTAPNLRVISRRSYASAIYEMVRSSVGDGTITDPTTVDKSVDNVNYTRSERWRVKFDTGDVALSQFHVYHDNGTVDDPAAADVWSAATPATGSLGVAYLDTARKVGFTVTDGATPFADGDQIEFQTYEDDAHPSVPIDSDFRLEIAPDVSNAPADFRPLVWKRVKTTGAVVADTVIPVDDVTVFGINQEVKLYQRADGVLISTRTVTAVSTGGNTITLDGPVSMGNGDYVTPTPIGVSLLAINGEFPYWLRAWAPAAAVRETKYPRWRAEAD